MENKKGEFVTRDRKIVEKRKDSYSSPNRNDISEVLVWYNDVESVMTSVEKGKNYIDFVVVDKNDNGIVKSLTKPSTLKRMNQKLPNYFVKINRSQIINVNHIIARTGCYLFTKLNTYKISRGNRKVVNAELSLFFH